jgi:DNA (cytosine-5)-methyltransferase 1
MKSRLLDLFCGAGGAAMGYHRAGFDVVGVDIRPQPNYPFEFIEADALEALRYLDADGFDAIHASPPCQRWSSKTREPDAHPDLIAPLRPMLQLAASEGVPYVIENVPGAPLENPVQLCGSSFNLGVRRHRHFECSFPLLVPPCVHGTQARQYRIYDHGRWYTSPIVHVFGTGGGKGAEHWADAMGIDWMTRPELADAIPPAYTAYIGLNLLIHIEETEKIPA